MQFSEKLLDTRVSELSVRELLSVLSMQKDAVQPAPTKEEKLFSEEEWIYGWANLASFCGRSVPTVRHWYEQGKLDKATRRIGAFYVFDKQWIRQHFM